MFELIRGNLSKAASNASELAQVAHAFGLTFWRPFGVFLEGLARAPSGTARGGLDDMRRGIELLREQSVLLFDGLLKVALAEAEARAGDVERAVAVLEEALATCERTGDRAFEAELHRVCGEMLLKRDPAETSSAEEALQTAVAVAQRQGTRSFELRAALSLARLHQSTARPVEAHAVLAPALEGFAPVPEMPEIAEAHALLAALSQTDQVKAKTAEIQRLTRLRVAYGNALFALRPGSSETSEAFAKAYRSAYSEKGTPERLAADYGLWAGSYSRGELPLMRTYAEVFLNDTEARPDSPEAGVAHRIMGVTHQFAGEFVQARDIWNARSLCSNLAATTTSLIASDLMWVSPPWPIWRSQLGRLATSNGRSP